MVYELQMQVVYITEHYGAIYTMKGVLHVSRWNPKLEGQPHKLSKLLASQELCIVRSWNSTQWTQHLTSNGGLRQLRSTMLSILLNIHNLQVNLGNWWRSGRGFIKIGFSGLHEICCCNREFSKRQADIS